MVGVRKRSSRSIRSTIPRIGFLLLILALAIVVWPKFQQTQFGERSDSSELRASRNENSVNGDLSTSVTAGIRIDSLDSEQKRERENTTSSFDGDLAIDEQTKDLLSLVTDSTLRISKREMPAYWELVRKTAKPSFSEIYRSANSKTKFNDFYSQPSVHRGELVSLDIVVRRVTRFDAEDRNPAGVKSVYEIWGATNQAHAWLYVFITDRLPEGVDEKTLLQKKVSFAGYFLKLLAYHPGAAPPNSKPLLAPLLIGRLQYNNPLSSPAIEDNQTWWKQWGTIATILLAAGFVAGRVYLNAKQVKRRRSDKQKLTSDFHSSSIEIDREQPASECPQDPGVDPTVSGYGR